MALNAENKSLEIFLRGGTLCVQKESNGEKSYITIPHKAISTMISGNTFIERIVDYAFGHCSNVSINISYDAKKYIMSNVVA